jgi:Recombinase
MRAITRRLYEQGVPTPTGRAVWASSTLGGMLRNRAYMSTAEWFRHETVAPPAPGKTHGRQALRPKEDWVRVPVPAIITEEVLEAAQRIKSDNSMFSPRRTTPGTWLLRGLVYCGACNVKAHAQPMRSTAENGTRKNRYYSCYHHDALRAGGVDKRWSRDRTRQPPPSTRDPTGRAQGPASRARRRQPPPPPRHQLRPPSRRRDRLARLRPTPTTAAPGHRASPCAGMASRAPTAHPPRPTTPGGPPKSTKPPRITPPRRVQ